MMNILLGGWQALVDYLTITRIISLTIAFFLSGAVATFMSKGVVMKYFGPNAKKGISYAIASVSGAILAVCSCSVLPMFASIRKKGAGIGPAITFLFAGPAINLLAIIFTFNLIGIDIGFARTFFAILLSIVIGLIMSILYHKGEVVDPNESAFTLEDQNNRTWWQTLIYFLVLMGILISGVSHLILTGILSVGLIVILILFFKKVELKEWCYETWSLAKKIVPLFIVGVFVAGILTTIIPQDFMIKTVGQNTFGANLLASIFGAFMYFATLTEVPIVNGFIALGMNKGPVLALLLAGPSLSLPNIIVIGKVLGVKKTFTYVLLVVVFATISGLLFGLI